MKILKNKKLLAIAAIVVCTSTSANATFKSGCHSGGGSTGGSNSGGTTTPSTCDAWEPAFVYDLVNDNGSKNTVGGTEFTPGSNGVVINDVGIKVSAWSDTGSYNGNGTYKSGWSYRTGYTYSAIEGSGYNHEEDITVQSADLIQYGQGFGVTNKDYNDSHTVDSIGAGSSSADYDMVLFSFSSEVQIDGATFSYLTNETSADKQITVIGLNDIGALQSGSSSWSDIANASNSNFVSAGSFQIENCEGVYTSFFTSSESAKYWLVGAYNPAIAYVDGFTENSGFKIASIGFKSGPDLGGKTDVSAPSSFALLILGGGLMAWRRRKA